MTYFWEHFNFGKFVYLLEADSVNLTKGHNFWKLIMQQTLAVFLCTLFLCSSAKENYGKKVHSITCKFMLKCACSDCFKELY